MADSGNRRRRVAANLYTVRDPARLARLLRHAIEVGFGGSQAAAVEAVEPDLAKATLSRLCNGKLGAITGEVREAIVRLVVRGQTPRTARAMEEDLFACFQSPRAAALARESLWWIEQELGAFERQELGWPFWRWTPSGLEVHPEGALEEWSAGSLRREAGKVWSGPLVFDAHRLCDRLRGVADSRRVIASFEATLSRRGFIAPPRSESKGAERSGRSSRAESPRLVDAFDPRVNRKRLDGFHPRAILAWRRILAALLAARHNPVERFWQELSDQELTLYLKHACAAELVLLQRPPDGERATTLADSPRAVEFVTRPWELDESR